MCLARSAINLPCFVMNERKCYQNRIVWVLISFAWCYTRKIMINVLFLLKSSLQPTRRVFTFRLPAQLSTEWERKCKKSHFPLLLNPGLLVLYKFFLAFTSITPFIRHNSHLHIHTLPNGQLLSASQAKGQSVTTFW